MTGHSLEIGPIGVKVADQIRDRREKWGMGYTELSRRLTRRGRPIPPLGLRRIESYQRRIDLDDAAALAAVLDLELVVRMEDE
jgi:ribosome-binding protein aMBF1 (putative translation factor)